MPRPRFDDEYDDHPSDGADGATGWFDRWAAEGLITEVLMPLKSGKEASVHLCRAVRSTTGEDLAAAKVFTPRRSRGFKDRSAYRHGMVILDAHARRAFEGKTRFGREVDEALWRGHEYATLKALHAAGADVPRPIAASDEGILMAYVGDEDGPAPQLRDVVLDPPEARRVLERLLWNVERFLANNLVHGDLSPYNVLLWQGRVTVIDLPQAVDPRTNRNARDLLHRDVAAICRYAGRSGVAADAERLATDLWRRFTYARL